MMNKLKNLLFKNRGEKTSSSENSFDEIHDLNEKAAYEFHRRSYLDDCEIDQKELELNFDKNGASRPNPFDQNSSLLIQEIIHDDYAGIHVEDDSRYHEVRGAVPSWDDFSMPQATIRAWTIGLILTTIGSAMNMYFSLHSPAIRITTMVISITAYPLGRLWAWCVPDWSIWGLKLNPGPFNVKEHAVITIMANASFSGGAAYATDILVTMNKFYNVDFGLGFAIVAILSTNMIGFSMGGLIRKFVVDSPSAIWPSNLVTCTFLTNMHINENHPVNGWHVSRLKFFLVISIGSFIYYWFPGYIFRALSYFSWLTWIRPRDVTVNQIFGSSSGLGMIPNMIALDWNQIAGYVGSPLIPPAGTIATVFLSMILIFWIITPIVSFTNTWYGDYVPISSPGSFDRYQNPYNVSRIVDTKTLTFIEEEYKKYSPLFLSTTFAISYGLSFASITATVMHTILFHGKEVLDQIRVKETPDVHNRLMARYKKVPEWWFLIAFLIFFTLSIVTIRCWDTEMPVWALIVALLIAFVFLLPVAIIFARTNILVGLNVLSEFIVGYMVPKKPLACLFFKTFGYISNAQAVTFASDMKLGHYMKIAPYNMFFAQFVAATWSCLVQIAVLKWAYGAVEGLCTPHQRNGYVCPGARVFFNASIIWGAIGPQRQFSHGQIYYGLLFFFIVGLILPIINWLILRKWPKSVVRYLHWPVFFSGTGFIPPATPFNYTSYCIVGLVFGWWIKRKYFHWWTKYNYSLSAGLDVGLAWSSLIISLAMGLTNTSFPSWWGNDVVTSTADYDTMSNIRKLLEPGEAFGPSSW
ncbi:uncharacterized protein LODBEIA_P10250 [Lodderomyces beijingensis]|uniref:Uncharacterized protein n=1 Tax=Lodderomyces beijingensis TaxID=1775926 RepID=A0ABP0ZI73_9ASCO